MTCSRWVRWAPKGDRSIGHILRRSVLHLEDIPRYGETRAQPERPAEDESPDRPRFPSGQRDPNQSGRGHDFHRYGHTWCHSYRPRHPRQDRRLWGDMGGAAIVSASGSDPRIEAVTIGRVQDSDVKDANDMGTGNGARLRRHRLASPNRCGPRASGCGCVASVFAAKIWRALRDGSLSRVLVVPT